MGYIKMVCLPLIFLFVACGAELDSRDNIAGSGMDELNGEVLEGSINLADGGTFDLKDDLNKPTLVLIFAQDTCSKCAREAGEIAARIGEIGALPTNVEIITYLVGTDPNYAIQDAQGWIEEHSVSWKVGFEKDGNDLFRKYFSSPPVVPSVIIQQNDEIIFTHMGQFGQARMEEITGEWR